MKQKTILFAFFILSVSLLAQTSYQGPASGSVPNGYSHSVTSTSLMKKSDGQNYKMRLFLHQKPTVEMEADPTIPTMREGENYYSLDGKRSMSKTASHEPVVFKSFVGTTDNGYIPPDPIVAAGPDHVIYAVNTEFTVVDKQGRQLANIDASDWYSPFISVQAIADPKVVYDQFDGRWLLVWIIINDSNSEAYYVLSVSDDSNPMGDWITWFLPSHLRGNTPAGNWADYPGIGYDDKALYFTSNNFKFAGGYDYAMLRIVPKSDVYVSTPGEVNYTDIWDIKYPGTQNTAFGIRPVRFHDAWDEYYFVASRWFSTPSSSMGLYKLTDPLNNPSLEAIAITTAPYSIPPTPQQLGGGEYPIEFNGVQITHEPVFRDGLLYITHLASYKTVTGLRFLTIDVFSEAAFTDIIYGTDTHYHLYPAIAVNANNDAVISYSRTSASEYVGAFFTLIDGSTQEPTITYTMQEGRDNYVKDYGTQRNRWGDYMGAWVDPADDHSFWVFAQYTDSKNRWGTWLTAVRPTPFEQAYTKLDAFELDFGKGEVSLDGASRVVKIANLGSQNLIINNFTISSNNFEIENQLNYPLTIASLDTLELSIKFTPDVHGAISDSLILVSNDQSSPDNKVLLKGEGFIITKAVQNTMYASTGRGGGSLGSILSIDLSSGAGEALGEQSGFKPLRSITINTKTNELLAINNILGESPLLVRLRASDGLGYEYKSVDLDLNAIAFDKDGVLHAVTTDNKYYLLDYESLDETFVSELGLSIAAITFHPLTGELYASVNESTAKDRIYKISSGGDTIRVGSTGLGTTVEAIAFDNNGNLYGAVGKETQLSKFISINPENGEGEEIGAVGFRGVLGLAYAHDPAVNVRDKEDLMPDKFVLLQNYPNPFNPSTKISFGLPEVSIVQLKLFNVLGQLIETLVSSTLNAGYHEIEWSVQNKNLSSGVYIYSLEAKGVSGKVFNETKKLVLMK